MSELERWDIKARFAYDHDWDKLPPQSVQFYYTPDDMICCKKYPNAESCIPIHTAEYAVEYGVTPTCEYPNHPKHDDLI